MQIERSKFPGVILSLLGKRSRGLRFDDVGVEILSPRHRFVKYSEIPAPAEVKKGILFCSISLSTANGFKFKVSGINPGKTGEFVTALNFLWQKAIREQVAVHAGEISTLLQAAKRLNRPRRYPAACLLETFRTRTEALFASIPWPLPEQALSQDDAQALEELAAFLRDCAGLRERAIDTFIKGELTRMSDFFDRIESNPLTPEQRIAVLTDEDATLVLAGAGSGKTSVITAKAAYLIERGIRRPEEILLMAFGKDAAAEMAERIERRCRAPITANTFHALAYGIIRTVEKKAPALAAHATDDVMFVALLRDILLDLASKRTAILALLVRWFTEFFRPERSEWDFKGLHDYYSYVEEQELRTLQGDLVRSFEELQIANWLYINGIAYEYEPVYEHPLPENDRGAYTPDFRLKHSGVYIEHFGVRKSRGPDGAEQLTTAPYIDRNSYLRDMAWKRQVHAEHGTTLIETYSYERVEGRLTSALAEKLKPYATLKPVPPEQVFARLSELEQIDAFTRLLATFLRHFKGSGRTLADCRKRNEDLRPRARGRAFLTIFEPVFAEYQRRLEPRIDFEDMIAQAAAHVREGRYRSPYRHLLVDEFQDMSQGRANLLKALKAQHKDARIFAVGDDWQSIYRFTGSDIGLMRNFGREFGGSFAGASDAHRTVDLGRSFRSVDRIAMPARSFVLKNPSQIPKTVIPAGAATAPAIRVAYSTSWQTAAVLQQTLENVGANLAGNGGSPTSVLLLGRYRHLRPKTLSALENAHPGLSIGFMTIHASKGLEADHVIILGAETGRLGLPSEIEDDPILDIVLPEPEKFHHAEERRAFYVALTRARKTVTILAPQDKRSPFVRELVENAEYGVIELGVAPAQIHRACPACGGRLVLERSGKNRARFVCEHKFHCGTVKPTCSGCGEDRPERLAADPLSVVCRCGARFPACPECADGWLVERTSRFGRFLGCVNYPRCNGRKRGGVTPTSTPDRNRSRPTTGRER